MQLAAIVPLDSCDIGTPEGHEAAKEKGLFTTTCPKFVRDAAEILEEMLPTGQRKMPGRPA
jgi:hypothetical protein